MKLAEGELLPALLVKALAMSELVVIIRPSFKKFCGDDACRAALFNHLLYWIAQKSKGQKPDEIRQGKISWYGTAELICTGMAESWSVNKIRKEIKELVDANLIGQRRNPDKGWDQTRHYFFGLAQSETLRGECVKHEICLIHLGLPADMLHLLNLVNAIDKSVKCNCQIKEMHPTNLVDRSDKFGNAIPKVSTKDTSKVYNKGNGGSSPRRNTPSGYPRQPASGDLNKILSSKADSNAENLLREVEADNTPMSKEI